MWPFSSKKIAKEKYISMAASALANGSKKGAKALAERSWEVRRKKK